MDQPIVNRVEASGILQVELTSWLQPPPVSNLDLSEWLEGGMVLREKAFRAAVDALDASLYEGQIVALDCSTQAILPDWAWMLVTSKLVGTAARCIQGNAQDAQTEAWLLAIKNLDIEPFKDARVIVKGCATPGGASILMAFVQAIQPHVKGLMFGEACSAVPLYKRPNTSE